MDLQQLLTFKFWFLKGTTFSTPALIAALAAFGGLFVAGIALKMAAAKSKRFDSPLRRVLRRFGSVGICMGIWGLLLVAFNYERVIFLNRRAWYLGWLLVAAFWIAVIVRRELPKIPRVREERKRRAEFEKYLP